MPQRLLAVAWLQPLLQLFTPLGGLKKGYMRLQQGVSIWPQLQLSQPQCHLVGAKSAAAGKLNVEQPVFQVRGLRAILEQQELLLRLLSQNAVLHTKLVVGELDFFDTEQSQ